MSATSLARADVVGYDGDMPVKGDGDNLRARDAWALLGVPEHTFYRFVREGLVRRYYGKRYGKLGFYRRDEIEALKRRLDEEERQAYQAGEQQDQQD